MSSRTYLFVFFLLLKTLYSEGQSDSARIANREIDSVNTFYFNNIGNHPDTSISLPVLTESWEPDTSGAIKFSSRFSLGINVCPVAISYYIKTDTLELLGIGQRPGHFRANPGLPSGLSVQCQLNSKLYFQAGCNFFQTEITLRDHLVTEDKKLINTVIYDGKTVVKYKVRTFQIPLSISHYSTDYDHSFYYNVGIKANFIYDESMNYEKQSELYYVAGHSDPFYKSYRSGKRNRTTRLCNITPSVSVGGCYTPDSRISILYYCTFDSFQVLKNKDAFFNLSYAQFGMQNVSMIYYF